MLGGGSRENHKLLSHPVILIHERLKDRFFMAYHRLNFNSASKCSSL